MSSKPPSVYFIALGCPKSEVDTDRMRALVASSAYTLARELDAADIAVVSTCGFIEPAVEESIEAVFELAEWRDQRSDRRLVVAGCVPSRYGSELEASLTEADAFIPVAEESGLLEVLERLTSVPGHPSSGPVRTDAKPSAYLQISDGCFRHCSFCTIPSIRGPYKSRTVDDIAEEAQELAVRGAREIVLIGQDTGAYGRDLDSDVGLPDVLRALSDIEDLAWLRIMYLQPDGISDALLDTMASLPKVCRYADIPLQHVVPRILKTMRRSGSAQEYLALIDRVREAMPDIVLRTSLIAGFPGENDADIDSLLGFLHAAELDYVGVFPFSPEDRTPAASLPNQVPESARVERAQRLRDSADEIGALKASQKVGKVLDVLVEGLDDEGRPVGRWRGQAPDVDGIVVLDRPIEAGKIVRATVTDSVRYDLEAEVSL